MHKKKELENFREGDWLPPQSHRIQYAIPQNETTPTSAPFAAKILATPIWVEQKTSVTITMYY